MPPGMPGMMPGMMPGGAPQSPEQMEAMLGMMEQNPQMMQMMQNMLESNPQMVRQMMEPQLAQLRQINPQAAAMMEDPNFLRTMLNPTTMRNMVQFQRAMGGGGGAMGAGMPPNPWGAPPPAGGAAAANPWGPSAAVPPMMGNPWGPSPASGAPGGLDFSSLLGNMQNMNVSSAATTPSPPQHPADRYRTQLQSLRDMGFDDEILSLRALERFHGNVNRAVDALLMGEITHDSTTAAASSEQQQQQQTTSTAATTDETTTTTTSATEDTRPENETPKDAAEKKND